MYYRSILRSVKHYRVNLIIKILIISDFLIIGSYQLFSPIFAIFITDKIDGDIKTVGFASAIYLVSKSLSEIPVGVYIDRTKSEKDDLWATIMGTLITAVVIFAYIFINSVTQLYILQIILGFGTAVSFPGWYSIFTRHIDKGKEAFEWSLYDVLLGLGMAGSAAVGGVIATAYGFDVLYTCVGILTIMGALLLLLIRNKVFISAKK